MNFLKKYAAICFNENGYPADVFLRRIVFLLWRNNSQRNARLQVKERTVWEAECANLMSYHFQEDEEDVDFKSFQHVSKLLVDGLISEGTLAIDRESKRFRLSGSRLAPDTPEARTANFSAVLKKLSEKTVKNPGSQRKLLQFLVNARNLYGFHFTDTTEGRAVFFPTGFAFDEHGYRLSSATVFVSTKRGLEIWDVSGDNSFELFSVDDRPRFRVNLGNSECNKVKTLAFNSTYLMPHQGASEHNRLIYDLSKQMKASVQCLSGKCELLSRIIGEEIQVSRWRGFVQSFYRVRSFLHLVRRAVFSILDTEIRRRAGRARKATYAHYNWFCSGSEEIRHRKLQASDAFPLFTGEFLSDRFSSAIELGLPLTPVVADEFNLTIPQARQLRGMHWQRLGSSIHNFDNFFKNGTRMFYGVPPEKMPKTKKEWKLNASIAELYNGDTVSGLSDAMIMQFNRNLVDRQKSVAGHSRLDIDGMMNDIAKTLAPIVTGEYSPYYVPRPRDMAAFLGAILGGNLGTKRLRALSTDWHRLAPVRTGAIRLMLRKIHDIPLATWEPLTENFECEHGTLNWLTNEAELISEGLRMRHCVGSYIDKCVLGVTHIASICGVNGDFSTVEIRLDGEGFKKGKPLIIQHRAYLNEAPDEKCEQVLSAYRKKYQRNSLISKGGASADLPPDINIPLCDTMRQSLFEAYKDCVPAKVFAMSRFDWEEAYKQYTRCDDAFHYPKPRTMPYAAF